MGNVQRVRDLADSATGIDLVIDNLSEFAPGYAGHYGTCAYTVSDYAVGNAS